MKILVCIKEIPQQETSFTISNDATAVYADESAPGVMNRYDAYALEEALLLRDSNSDIEVHALSLGPERVENVLRRAVEMGADEAFRIHLSLQYSDDSTLRSTLISNFIKSGNYSLVLMGAMSEDAMKGVLGPMTAARLGFSLATAVTKIQIDAEKRSIIAEREVDSQSSEILELLMPAVLTIQTGINQPRYPTLTYKMRARSYIINTVEADCGYDTVDRYTSTFRAPPSERETLVLKGTPEETARQLADHLRRKSFLGSQQ